MASQQSGPLERILITVYGLSPLSFRFDFDMQFVYLFICVCSPRSKRECPKDILMPKWQTNNETTDICTGYPGYTEGYLSATCLAAFDLPTQTQLSKI